MADLVASTTIQDGQRLAVMRFTNVSDGSGESAVVKVDASALEAMANGNKSTNIKIMKCWWTISGMDVDLLWDASTNVHAISLTSDGAGYLDFSSFGCAASSLSASCLSASCLCLSSPGGIS